MAPERFQKSVADERGDIYALACVLYQALTGEQPFPAGSLEQIAVAHMLEPPPRPSEAHATVSRRLGRRHRQRHGQRPRTALCHNERTGPSGAGSAERRTRPCSQDPARRNRARSHRTRDPPTYARGIRDGANNFAAGQRGGHYARARVTAELGSHPPGINPTRRSGGRGSRVHAGRRGRTGAFHTPPYLDPDRGRCGGRGTDRHCQHQRNQVAIHPASPNIGSGISNSTEPHPDQSADRAPTINSRHCCPKTFFPVARSNKQK